MSRKKGVKYLKIISIIALAIFFVKSAEAQCPPPYVACAEGCGYNTGSDNGTDCVWSSCTLYPSGTQPQDDGLTEIPDQCVEGTYYDYYCDGTTEARLNNTVITDADGDGYDTQCDGHGYPAKDCTGLTEDCGGDCDDSNATIHPYATELCDNNSVDENCDGQVNEGCACTNGATQACLNQEGVCSGSFETCVDGAWQGCNSTTYLSYNASYETSETTCDGLDNDCDGSIDNGAAVCCYDNDGDTYPYYNATGCTSGNDCNDTNASINPGAAEVCNFVDDDCDNFTDEGFNQDDDGYFTCGGDCDDTNASIRPGAMEICEDGIDQNCDSTDPSCSCIDSDNDSYSAYDNATCPMGTDCDDTDLDINPDTSEICDSKDNNCDGNIDENLTITCSDDSQCNADGCYEGVYRDYSCLYPGTCNSYCAFELTGSCSSGGGGTVTDTIAVDPLADITYPISGSRFRVGERVSFTQSSNNYGSQFLWKFGDGATDDSENTGHIYDSPGSYTISLKVTNSQGEDSDGVTIDIIECESDDECEGLCCAGICTNPCQSSGDCADDEITGYTLTSYECISPGTCEYECAPTTCEIECLDETDCDDNDETTEDSCMSPKTCESRCENIPKEIIITINEPEDTEYDNERVPLDFTTNYDVECYYELNSGNKEKVHSHSFILDAREGKNKVTVICEDAEESVSFRVKEEETDDDVFDDVFKGNDTSVLDMFRDEEIILEEEDVEEIILEVFTLEKFEIRKQVRYVQNKSNISITITNPKPITEQDVRIRQSIPKRIAQTADKISSDLPYDILRHDPVIEFTIDRMEPGDQAEIYYLIDRIINETELKGIKEYIHAKNITQEQIDEAKDKQKETEDAVTVTQKVKKDKGKTQIETKLSPKNKLEGVNVYLKIPKCAAEHVNQIKFKNKNFKVIADDPLIMWQFEKADEEILLSYELEKELDDDCLKELKAMIIAQDVGDEIVTDVPITTIAWPFLLIPLLAGILIYFHKFEVEIPKKEMPKEKHNLLELIEEEQSEAEQDMEEEDVIDAIDDLEGLSAQDKEVAELEREIAREEAKESISTIVKQHLEELERPSDAEKPDYKTREWDEQYFVSEDK